MKSASFGSTTMVKMNSGVEVRGCHGRFALGEFITSTTGLRVGNGKDILEATVAVSELRTSPLLRLDTLATATDFLAAAVISR